MTQREGEGYGGPLLLSGIRGEASTNPAECKELERDGLSGMRALKRHFEALACLDAVPVRECRKADAAERRDQSPAVVALGERLVAGAREPQGLGVVAKSVCAVARATERIACST